MKPSKKNIDGRMSYKLIYNHYLGPSNIDHMVDGEEEKLYPSKVFSGGSR